MTTRRSKTGEMIRLVRAAAIAGRSYRAMLDSVLRHEVHGRQDAGGRWWVRAADARRLVTERRASETDAA